MDVKQVMRRTAERLQDDASRLGRVTIEATRDQVVRPLYLWFTGLGDCVRDRDFQAGCKSRIWTAVNPFTALGIGLAVAAGFAIARANRTRQSH